MARRSLIQRLRQHHGIEHATVTLLSRRLPGAQLVARSDGDGFIVYGDVDTATLRAVAEEALARLQAGASELAIHPNCGTNLVTAGALSGIAALLAAGGRKRSLWDRVPGAILGATLALTLAVPLGRWMQLNVTTSSAVRQLRVAAVTRLENGPVPRHRVTIA
ncbi:MAG: hypothetical protein CVU38_12715 [Chloroflexi bacterium HGW-Chloroflexi-1]|nr:MAG: hypothetical protein CVU38_12715 [Chloroflexi bacterium HGW-Chloroflexi-1]